MYITVGPITTGELASSVCQSVFESPATTIDGTITGTITPNPDYGDYLQESAIIVQFPSSDLS